jgi:hypothetical protein
MAATCALSPQKLGTLVLRQRPSLSGFLAQTSSGLPFLRSRCTFFQPNTCLATRALISGPLAALPRFTATDPANKIAETESSSPLITPAKRKHKFYRFHGESELLS